MKSKKEKIYTYIVLLIGIIITYFYFYHLGYGLPLYDSWNINDTYFSGFWKYEIGVNSDIVEGLYYFLQIFFLISWFYIRDDLIKLIKIIHSKI